VSFHFDDQLFVDETVPPLPPLDGGGRPRRWMGLMALCCGDEEMTERMSVTLVEQEDGLFANTTMICFPITRATRINAAVLMEIDGSRPRLKPVRQAAHVAVMDVVTFDPGAIKVAE
jgi:hypothetical protein